MKYRKSLIIPTIISTGLFTSTMVISADEMDSDENATHEITEAEIVETEETETQEDPATHSEEDMETTQDDANADTQTGETEMAPEKEAQPEVPADEKTAESNETEEHQPKETNDESSLNDRDLHNDKEENSTEETGDQENSPDTPGDQQIEEEDSIDDTESQQDAESDKVPEPDNQEDTSDSEMTEETVEENNIDDAESQEEAESDNVPEPDNQEDTIAPENNEETEDEEVETPETEGGADSEEEDSSNEEMTDNSSEDEIAEKDSSNNEDDQTEDQSGDNEEKPKDEEEPVLEEETEMNVFSQLQDDSSPVYTDAQLAARINNSDNAGLFSPLWSDDSVSAERFMDSTLYATRQADYNNETYYLTFNGLDGAMQGWMKGQDLDLLQHSSPGSHDADYYINPSQSSQYLLDEPWGNSNQRLTQLNQYNHNDVFNAEQSINVGEDTFYYGQIDNDYGWVQDTSVQDISTPVYTEAQLAARINNSDNAGLFSPLTSDDSVSAERFMDSTLYVTRQADYNNETYYLTFNGIDGAMQGWMKGQDLDLLQHSSPSSHDADYYINPSQNSQYLLNEPWGNSNQRVTQLNQYNHNDVFNAEQSINVGEDTFYYGQIGNDYGWVQDTSVQDISTPVYTEAQLAARINNSDNAGLFSPLTSDDSVSADRFMDSTLYATRQADYNNETYYLTFNGLDGAMQGWMKGQDLDLLQHSSPGSHDADYYINPSQSSQYLLDEPWGNSNQRVTQLNQYNHSEVFNAEQSINVGEDTFYYGQIGNDYGWVQSSHVTSNTPEPPANEPEVTTIQYDYSLEEVLDIQMNLGTPPQAWADGGGWRNATRDEVREFVDTSNQQGGAWDYTFLNLDESQGLSASVLDNNLLSNRGILTNQGNAFAQASETHGVNEVYLISHAILETGHGESQLAQGVTLDSNGNISNSGTTYYNMYGIGAVDNNALLGGARYAQQMGWDTPAKAIIGGANFVSQNYFNRGQNTLYSMRWNPENPGAYQYATDVNWAHATARNIQSYYNTLGVEGRSFTRYTF